jgi:uncharacterized protein (TIGR03089 family)
VPDQDPSPTDVAGLLASLRADDPGRPRVTWYGPAAGEGAGERIELSARVLSTWVAKTVGLLQDELDVEPGSTVRLHLPGHWKSLVWVLACWAVGAHLVGPDEDADLVVTADPDAAGPDPAALLVVVALPSLARSWSAPLPAGAVDYAAVVAGFADDLPPGLPAATLPAHAGTDPGTRALLDTRDRDAVEVAVAALGPLAGRGSVVLAARGLTDGERASELLAG